MLFHKPLKMLWWKYDFFLIDEETEAPLVAIRAHFLTKIEV